MTGVFFMKLNNKGKQGFKIYISKTPDFLFLFCHFCH